MVVEESNLSVQIAAIRWILGQQPGDARWVETIPFQQDHWLVFMARMGVSTSVELSRLGFYPAGGGEVCATVEPSMLRPLHLNARGELRTLQIVAVVARCRSRRGAGGAAHCRCVPVGNVRNSRVATG